MLISQRTFYSRFNAFFLFSAFVAPPPVAARLTAFGPCEAVVETKLILFLSTTAALALNLSFSIFASAVESGDGERCRSLLETRLSLLEDGDGVRGIDKAVADGGDGCD